MSSKLDCTKVTNGNIILVANIARAPQELKTYILLYVEDLDGGNEVPLLFTSKELDKVASVELPLKQVPGRLYPVRVYGRNSFAVRVIDWNKAERTLLVTEKALHKWRSRAINNPEDILSKTWWDDLMD